MNASPFSKEPGHDEIALCAFLIWEREGCQPGQEMTYWLQAEREIRATYQKKAAQIAALAAKPWPPAPRVSAAPSAPVAKTTPKAVAKPAVIKPATKVVAKSVTKTATTKTLTKAAPKTASVTKSPLTTAARLAPAVKTTPVTKSSARASFSTASKPAARAVRRAA